MCMKLCIKSKALINEKEKKKNGFNPNSINFKLISLVRMVHGSFESKSKICDAFNAQNPECSKTSIEKKLKELFVKD